MIEQSNTKTKANENYLQSLEHIPNFPDTIIDHDCLEEDAIKVLALVWPKLIPQCSFVLPPHSKNSYFLSSSSETPKYIVSCQQFKDGITNKLLCFTFSPTNEKEFNRFHKGQPPSHVLIRTYGKKSELLINRVQEILVLIYLIIQLIFFCCRI